ncbi:hypothetical protein FOA52_008501 [Chlamydomonas sp. UWO 241]|nr:hypothetical protein FOA52_008501 [Chlamydomonas sp. UWO 241]
MLLETQAAGYMIRPHLHANLYDRLSTRPFLSGLEKRWITYQLLQALAQCQEAGVCHGDITAENVLLTSWAWAYLVDFAPYKPTYLPADNPAEFSYFFDTGGRRRCYIAPERFYSDGPRPLGPLTPQMDVFSLGCVIAELFLDGKAFLGLGQLLSLKQANNGGGGGQPPWPQLAGLDPEVRALIEAMVQLDPAARCPARQYLERWKPLLLPEYFDSVLHPFFASLLPMDTDARVAAAVRVFPQVQACVSGSKGLLQGGPSGQLQTLTQQLTQQAQQGTEGLRLPTPAAAPLRGGAAGSSSTTGSSPSPPLLGDVGDLLDGLSKLAVGDNDDGGFIVDDHQVSDAPPPTPDASASIDEVFSESVWEYQGWDGAGEEWSADAAQVPAARSREQVGLPAEPGWAWAGEWSVDGGRPGERDPDGWEYCEAAPATAAGHAGGEAGGDAAPAAWRALRGGAATTRRRRWLRQRRRRLPAAGASAAPLPPLPPPSPLGRARRAPPPALAAPPAGGAVLGLRRMGSGIGGAPGGGSSGSSGGGDGMWLLSVLLCTLLRGARMYESKRAALSLLVRAALQCDDELRLQCVVPYLVTLLSDNAAGIRSMALRCLVKVMCSIRVIPPSDSKVFQDYLIPSLSLLPNDVEEAVRVEYALGIAQLAAAAHRHLMRLQNQVNKEALEAAASGSTALSPAPSVQPFRYDAELALVRSLVKGVVQELVISPRSTGTVKRGMLRHSTQLALLFGRRDLNDRVLPLLITCLNATDWCLRSSFFSAVSSIGAFTGHESLDVFLLPCLEQALMEASQTSVVADAVRSIASVVPYLRKRSLLGAVRKVAPLLESNDAAVRAAVVRLLSAAARAMSSADVHTQLLGLLRGQLVREPLDAGDEAQLAACLARPAASHTRRQHALMRADAAAGAGGFASPLAMRIPGGGGNGHAMGDGAASAAAAAAAGRAVLLLRPGSAADGIGGGEGEDAGQQQQQAQQLLLRPVAPVYVMELDPGALAAAAADGAACCPPASEQSGTSSSNSSVAVAVVDCAGGLGGDSVGNGAARAGGGGPARGGWWGGLVGAGPAGLSLHRAAIASIAPRVAALEARVGGEGGGGGGGAGASAFAAGAGASAFAAGAGAAAAAGGEPIGDKAQLERARGALARLRAAARGAGGNGSNGGGGGAGAAADVRSPASLHTFQLLQLSVRTVPPLAGLGGNGARGTGASGFTDTSGAGGSGANGNPGSASSSSQAVSDAVAAAMAAPLPGTHPGAALGGASSYDSGGHGGWRPRGALLAHLAEHRKAVHALCVSRGGAYAVSASSDGTAKVWDLQRLERDVSFASRLTYAAQPGRLTSVAAVEDDQSVASASSQGSLHVWRVEYTVRARSGGAPDTYTGVTARRQISPGHGAVLCAEPAGPHTLLYTTQRGGVHCWDLRARGDAWRLPLSPERGLLEHMAPEPQIDRAAGGVSSGPSWLVTGSSRGFVTLWDVRFQLPAAAWQHPAGACVDALALAAAPHARLGLPVPSGPMPPLLYIAAGRNEVALWDAATGRCAQVLRCLDPADVAAAAHTTHVPAALTPAHSASALTRRGPGAGGGGAEGGAERDGGGGVGGGGAGARAHAPAGHQVGSDGLLAPQPRPPGVRCLLPLASGGLLTGGSDRGVRLWDGARPQV